KAAGKKAHAKALCYAKAAAAGVPVSQACLDKAEAQFSLAFANAEEKASKSGGCVTQSDVADVENRVDMFISDVVSALPGTTTTSPTLSWAPLAAPQPRLPRVGCGPSEPCPALRTRYFLGGRALESRLDRLRGCWIMLPMTLAEVAPPLAHGHRLKGRPDHV